MRLTNNQRKIGSQNTVCWLATEHVIEIRHVDAWGIETDFRVIKEEFLAKCKSRNSALRSFYFNFAAHLFNIWTVANILRADETGYDLSEEKQLTAGELMQAIEDDPNDLQIPTEPIRNASSIW